MIPEFLSCLTGEVAVPFSELGSTRKHWVCEADPKSGGRQLGHPNGDGEEVAKYIDPERRVRSYRDLFRAPEGS